MNGDILILSFLSKSLISIVAKIRENYLNFAMYRDDVLCFCFLARLSPPASLRARESSTTIARQKSLGA